MKIQVIFFIAKIIFFFCIFYFSILSCLCHVVFFFSLLSFFLCVLYSIYCLNDQRIKCLFTCTCKIKIKFIDRVIFFFSWTINVPAFLSIFCSAPLRSLPFLLPGVRLNFTEYQKEMPRFIQDERILIDKKKNEL